MSYQQFHYMIPRCFLIILIRLVCLPALTDAPTPTQRNGKHVSATANSLNGPLVILSPGDVGTAAENWIRAGFTSWRCSLNCRAQIRIMCCSFMLRGVTLCIGTDQLLRTLLFACLMHTYRREWTAQSVGRERLQYGTKFPLFVTYVLKDLWTFEESINIGFINIWIKLGQWQCTYESR